MEEFQNFSLGLPLGSLHPFLLLGHQVVDAFKLQVRQQVHIGRLARDHIRQRLQLDGRLGVFTGHLVAVVAIHHDHRVLAHQVTGVELVAAIVAHNVAREVAVRLLERAAIRKLVKVDRGPLQERALLRKTRQGVHRNGNLF